jgi:hypothetical protein
MAQVWHRRIMKFIRITLEVSILRCIRYPKLCARSFLEGGTQKALKDARNLTEPSKKILGVDNASNLSVSAELKRSPFSWLKGEPLSLTDSADAHLDSGRYLETSAVIVASSLVRTLRSHMLLPRRPLQPVLRNSRGVDIRLDRSREQVAILPRCEPPLLSACRALA